MWIFFPTLADLCGLSMPPLQLDGVSLKGVLTGEEALPKGRVEFMQYHQSTVVPSKWESSVVSDQWRLVRGKELYDIKADPGQNRDIAGQHPEVVRRLRAAHEAYWQEMQGTVGGIFSDLFGRRSRKPYPAGRDGCTGRRGVSQISVALAQKSTGGGASNLPGPAVTGLSFGAGHGAWAFLWETRWKRKGYRSWRRSPMRYGPTRERLGKKPAKRKLLRLRRQSWSFSARNLRRKRQEGRRARFFPSSGARREKRIYPPAL